MKRAHYAGGVAVLTPFALAMAMPTAQASTTATPGAHGKGVSLHPIRVSVRPDNGCTGTQESFIPPTAHGTPDSHVRGHFWKTRHSSGSLCVGTVVVSAYFTKNICKAASASIKIFGSPHAVIGTTICGTKSHWSGSALGFHSLFLGDAALGVSVCVTSQYDGGHKNCVGFI